MKVGVGVGVMLLKDGKILLGQRNIDPKKASSILKGEGSWSMPGGKLEFGEEIEDCASRELHEEAGMKMNSMKVLCVNNDKIDSAHFVTIGVLSEDFEGVPESREEAIRNWEWFDLDNLPSPLYFPSERLIENYKRGEFYLKRTS